MEPDLWRRTAVQLLFEHELGYYGPRRIIPMNIWCQVGQFSDIFGPQYRSVAWQTDKIPVGLMLVRSRFGQECGDLHSLAECKFFLTSCGSCGSLWSLRFKSDNWVGTVSLRLELLLYRIDFNRVFSGKCLLNKGVQVGSIFGKFWRTSETKSRGFGKFWDQTFMGIIQGPVRIYVP